MCNIFMTACKDKEIGKCSRRSKDGLQILGISNKVKLLRGLLKILNVLIDVGMIFLCQLRTISLFLKLIIKFNTDT